MKERILEFLKKENKTSAQLAEEIGVQPSGISHILSGRNKPSLDFVLKMLEKYSFLSTDWLLFGRGSMYVESKMADLFTGLEMGKPETGKEIINAKHEKALSDRSQDLNINEAGQERSEPEHSQVAKIVWFFENSTFKEYYPEKD